jgi:ligand-binding SRPBCC domain-containing protein
MVITPSGVDASSINVDIEKGSRERRGYRLTTQLLVAESREDIFSFFSDAFQLETITPPWLKFAVTTPRPIEMSEGTLIDYKLRLRGIPIRWRSKISQWRPPLNFVDEQVTGPYLFWHHLHTFHEVEDGTLVQDIVQYGVPLGFIMHPVFVQHELKRIFEYRRERLTRIFTPINE